MPSEYRGTDATIVDSSRNAQGTMVGSIIRNSVAKVEMSWKFLSKDDWARILQLFNADYGGNFYNDVTFFCETAGGYVTKKMYCGDRTSGGVFMMNAQGNVVGYKNPKLSLIEV